MTEALSSILTEPRPIVAFIRLADYYRQAAPEERIDIRAAWPFHREWDMPGLDYSDDPCGLRVIFKPLWGRDRNGLTTEDRLRARLIYHAIENFRYDFRDNGIDLCLCYHTALIAGLDVSGLFEEAAAVSDDGMAANLRGRLRWPPEARSLWAMGFQEAAISNGVVYRFIGLRDDYYELKPKHLDEWGRRIKC